MNSKNSLAIAIAMAISTTAVAKDKKVDIEDLLEQGFESVDVNHEHNDREEHEYVEYNPSFFNNSLYKQQTQERKIKHERKNSEEIISYFETIVTESTKKKANKNNHHTKHDDNEHDDNEHDDYQAPGNSGSNGNDVSGSEGNQGNDKDVGNAGGNKNNPPKVTIVKVSNSQQVSTDSKTGTPVKTTTTTSHTTTSVDDQGNTITTVWKTYTDTWTTTTTITETIVVTETTHYSDGSTSSQVLGTNTSVVNQFTETETATRQEIASQTITPPEVPEVVGFNHDAFYGDNSQYLGTPTDVPSHDPNYYVTSESNNGSVLEVKANYAYSRGWTGKGSTILVMDTGIDTDHIDLKNKIKYNWNPGYDTGIEDIYGHGTIVASIAAGAKNDIGTHGIAYDADLAVANIADKGRGYYYARGALDWAKDKEDIVVANLSFNAVYQNEYVNSLTDHGNGIYTSDHQYYGGSNYYNMERPENWADAMSSEIVLTVPAGNTEAGYVQNPATFAAATNSNGDLVLDGRMIVVGNWNTSTKTVDGAKAGHICKDYSNNKCNDKYRTSDFYMLAPGVNVGSATNDGGWNKASGGSTAAPAVAGGVAIIHQMWPYMKGKNIVQLLLQTADKDLPNYQEEVHGQGLMDLDKATQPVGDLGISLTGRTGNTVPITGAIRGITLDLGTVSTLSSVKAVDTIDRDYSIDITGMTDEDNAPLQTAEQMSHRKGQPWSAKFVSTNHLVVENTNMAVGYNQEISVGHTFDVTESTHLNVTYSKTNYHPWLDFTGTWGEMKGANTFDTSVTQDIGDFYVQGGVMTTTANFDKGLVSNVDTIVAGYAVAGYEVKGLRVFGGVKPQILEGGLDLTVPSTVDANGNMSYTTVESDITTSTTGFLGFGLEGTTKLTGQIALNQNLNGAVDTNGDFTLQYNVGFKF